MKILIKMSLAVIFVFALVLPGVCTEIPKPIADFINHSFPKSSIRFDGLVELPDGTQYIPVIPVNYADVENPASIIQTIPAKASFTSKPDLILFANNFSLLKIIKKPGAVPTLLSNNAIPLTVKLGILPQDFVVPENFVVPYDLKIIIGDLKITVNETANQSFYFAKNNSSGNAKLVGKIKKSDSKQVAPELKDLTNKLFYVSNFRSNKINIVNPQTGRSKKDIILSSIPYNIKTTEDGRYILASCVSTNKISIIDTYNTNYVRDINVGNFPSSIVVAPGTNIAYVANRDSSTISVINLRTMELIKNIPITGMPVNLIMAQDNNRLYYSDLVTGSIYEIDLNDIDTINLITQADNISKICQYGDNLYILSRTDDSLTVYSLTDNKQVKKIDVGSKPVDIKILPFSGKIYVLSAGANTLSIINMNSLEISKTVTLKNGFPSGINIMAKAGKALIFNQNSNEITIFDLNQEQIIGYLPVNAQISALIVSEINKE